MILVTGGAGYIGSHACLALLTAGEGVVAFDNFSNSSPEALKRVQKICGKAVAIVEGDIRDQTALEKVLTQYRCSCRDAFCRAEVGPRFSRAATRIL